nr:addiction module protein [Desulfobacula sp.]
MDILKEKKCSKLNINDIERLGFFSVCELSKLIISTNLSAQNDVDQAWVKEVERRCQEVDNGIAKLIPGEEVFDKIVKMKSGLSQ